MTLREFLLAVNDGASRQGINKPTFDAVTDGRSLELVAGRDAGLNRAGRHVAAVFADGDWNVDHVLMARDATVTELRRIENTGVTVK
jgi:hypothetical protein